MAIADFWSSDAFRIRLPRAPRRFSRASFIALCLSCEGNTPGSLERRATTSSYALKCFSQCTADNTQPSWQRNVRRRVRACPLLALTAIAFAHEGTWPFFFIAAHQSLNSSMSTSHDPSASMLVMATSSSRAVLTERHPLRMCLNHNPR